MFGRQVQREAIMLGLGDLGFFILALWLTLWARYLVWPPAGLFLVHLRPFSILFLVWLVVFFIADLYNCRLSLRRARLAPIIVNAQLANSFLAIVFFYFIPYFDITPKLTLFVNLIFSLILILWWRLAVSNFLYRGRSEKYIFLCQGTEVTELKRVLQKSERNQVEVADETLPFNVWRRAKIAVAVINFYETKRPEFVLNFYQAMFAGVRFVSVHELYENTFGRIPISAIDERWFVEYAETSEWPIYRLLKRLMDVVLASFLSVLSLVFYPLIALAIKLEDGGPLFYTEERVGRFGQIFKIRKFRSMTTEAELTTRRTTRVGGFLRRTRLDELPQLLSVIIGCQSLIGPRPERPEYVAAYEREIPHYQARHLVLPGLSGWAQIYQEHHPHFRLAAEATREKLSYDLYYVKNRSFWLDLKIALKTIRTLLSRSGL